MDVKVNKCCYCLELRLGCILIEIVGLINTVVTVIVYGGIPSFIGIPVALIGSVSLVFAAVKKNGSTRLRIIAVLIHMETSLVRAFFNFIGIILTCVSWSNVNSNPGSYANTEGSGYHGLRALAVVELLVCTVLDIYFLLVAFSFYQELKEGNETIQFLGISLTSLTQFLLLIERQES